ncbi:MAG TPA: hotdog domain-containing protein [Caulobacteraceae bacterium]|jgi:acyl-coenzyme A thioesterase PaaI-like protein
MDEATAPAPPEGFASMARKGEFWRMSGPYFDRARAAITLHLSIDFLAPARNGDWVNGEAEVTRETPGVVFASARLHSAARDVALASGLFKPVRPAGS